MHRNSKLRNDKAFMAGQGLDIIHQYSSMKELSKGIATSRSSSSLDDTVSNSSSSCSSCSSTSSYFDFASAFLSTSLSESQQQPCSSKNLLVPRPKVYLNEGTDQAEIDCDVRRFRYRKLSPRKLLALVSSNRDEILWEEVEDDFYILLEGRLDRLQIFRDFFFQTNCHSEGRLRFWRSCDFLLRLGYLLSSKHKDLAVHDDYVSQFASFLSTGRDSRFFKLAVVRILHRVCLSTPNNAIQDVEKKRKYGDRSSEEHLYDFLTNRTREWGDELVNNFSTDAVNLVYEIRAKCLRDLDLERDRIRSVAETGNSTAVVIATGAKIVELGIQKSNKVMEGQINNAGKKMKGWIDEENQGVQPRRSPSDHEAIVARAISSSTKRASEYAKQSSKFVAQSTVDTTLSGFFTLGNKVEESTEMAEQLSPESREIIKAAGKIGIASVGAVALVAEAVVESSRSLSSKTAVVTADIVGHKYGSVAGEVARDAADTYTNVLETMGNITLASNGSKLMKTAAKNVGKNQIDDDVERAKHVMLKLERQGAIVAKHTLGIQWIDGSLTRELLCDAVPEEEKQKASLMLHKGNLSDKNKSLS